jgi:hypothetical protein
VCVFPRGVGVVGLALDGGRRRQRQKNDDVAPLPGGRLAREHTAYFPTHTETTSLFLSFLHIGCRYSA